jgi:hypothetical protein
VVTWRMAIGALAVVIGVGIIAITRV